MTLPPAADGLRASLSGSYRLERELGAGGMATVYLAHDLKHDRKVALKVLRPELAAVIGAERFLAEIRTTANLQHPHILPLFDSGQVEGTAFYAMPLIEGESLRDRLTRDRQLPIPEALRITTEIAQALDYAHRHQVIHRDIKPENILLQDGAAMLADFGIALAVNQAGGHRLTETGLSLGTPQYMSPEQATGDRELDARSDIYSLGAVLYEMLAGEPPHTGVTAQAIVAKLLTERPTRLRTVRDTVPEAVEVAVNTALAKAPVDRFQTAGGFAAALLRPAAPVAPPRNRARSILIAAGGIGLLLLLALGARSLLRSPGPVLSIGRSEQLTSDPGLEIQPDISPDGRFVAYAAGTVARMRIFIRPLGGGRTIPLSDDSSAVESLPQWSPDGTKLLYLTRGGASVAAALGGSSRPVIPPSPTAVVGSATWSPDGSEFAFVRGDSVLAAPVEGGPGRLVGTGDQPHSCRWSPNGKWIVCAAGNATAIQPGKQFGNLAPSAIVLYPAAGGAGIPLTDARTFNESPLFSPDGGRVFFLSNRDGPRDVYVLGLSSSGKPRGEPARLTTGLGALSISLSADGRRLAYGIYSARANVWSLPISEGVPAGLEAATPVTSGNQVIESIQVSRDGRWLVYDSDLRGNADIYRIPIGGGEPEQLTNDPVDEFSPDLSPDGTMVAYHSWRLGTRDIEIKPLDGGPVEQVTATPGQESYPRWSSDGRALLVMEQNSVSITIIRRGSDGRWGAPTALASEAISGDWSPDDRRVTFINASTNRVPGRIMIVAATGGAPERIGGALPLASDAQWSPDGRTIYVKVHDSRGMASFWMAGVSGGAPRLVAQLTDPARQSSRKDFATDGRHLYFTIEDRQSDVFVAQLIEK